MRARGGFAAAAAALTTLVGSALAPSVAAAVEAAAPVSFSTVGESQFVVPAGVASVNVALVGAAGGAGRLNHPGAPQGGRGGEVQGTLAVTPGEVLFVEIGASGAEASVFGAPGGSNGGGEGAYGGGIEGSGNAEGGGGGGASDVRSCPVNPAAPGRPAACAATSTLSSRLLVAGGGGGAGGESSVHGSGGAGGAAGSVGNSGATYGSQGGGLGGGPGERLAGGLGGGNSLYFETEFKSFEDHPAQPGGLGVGGAGGGYNEGGGGGGGGGIYGGGGGGGGDYKIEGPTPTYGGGGGGGGGASGAPASVGGVTVTNVGTAPAAAQASATFTWTLPPPTAVTGAAESVTSTTAVITGTVNADGSTVSDCHFAVSPAPPAGSSIPCSQQVGAGSTPVAVSAVLSGLSPATKYTITLVAASAQGSSTGSAVTFATSAMGSSLSVTNVKLSTTRFRRGRRAARIARARAIPGSTKISFGLSQPATVSLTFRRAATGVLVGHTCTAVSRAHRKGRRCTRYMPVSRGVTLAGHAGTNSITFDGVLDRGARLSPSVYRLAVSATSAGARATAAQQPTFTVLGP